MNILARLFNFAEQKIEGLWKNMEYSAAKKKHLLNPKKKIL
jgi:hypothetical protein